VIITGGSDNRRISLTQFGDVVGQLVRKTNVTW